LQLDYIRYPVSLPVEQGFCYCDFCRKQFSLDYPVDPLSIDPESDPEIWKQWNRYREEQINAFVRSVHELLKSRFPEIRLSADVFPMVKESRETKMQNWGYWLKKGFLQEIFTMSYTPDVRTVKEEAIYLKNILPEGIPGYVGLGPYQGFRPEILLDEIQAARQANTGGVCLFEFGSLTSEQKTALKQGPFRLKAKVPDWK